MKKKNRYNSKKKKSTYKKRKHARWKKKAGQFLDKLKKTLLTVGILTVLAFMISAFIPADMSSLAVHTIGTKGADSVRDVLELNILEDAIDTVSDCVYKIHKLLSGILSTLRSIDQTIHAGDKADGISLDNLPAYTDEPYVVVNHNNPTFTKEEIKKTSFEYYSELDLLGRCGMTMACVGRDIMPTEERGPIGMVRPSGWKLKKYDIVDGKYIYNRCHLIGYQLTGENANVKNLITGTRYMNVEGMLPFENKVAEYVRKTGNHVMYRVTPIFEENNMVASGVLMEAYSVEDKGAGICFHVYVYNVQPGIKIDYATGETWLAE